MKCESCNITSDKAKLYRYDIDIPIVLCKDCLVKQALADLKVIHNKLNKINRCLSNVNNESLDNWLIGDAYEINN
jgi:hypothetical protein